MPVWFQTTAIKKIFDKGSHTVFWFPSAGEGIGYPLQYSGASLVAQLVKNPLASGTTGFDPWVRSLCPLEDMATYSSILAWRISMDRRARWAIVHGVAKSPTRLSD